MTHSYGILKSLLVLYCTIENQVSVSNMIMQQNSFLGFLELKLIQVKVLQITSATFWNVK